jgi:hypothetical protein
MTLPAALNPLIRFMFPPVPLAEQVHRTPTLIVGVLEISLAAAFLALWGSARDFRVFRTLGLFYFVIAGQGFFQYFGGYNNPIAYSLRALVVTLLVEAAGQAMQLTRTKWTRVAWPVYLFAAIATWFPGYQFANDCLWLASEIVLGVLLIQGFRSGNRRIHMIAAAFAALFVIRFTISSWFEHLNGMHSYVDVGGWQWPPNTVGITLLGIITLAILVSDLMRDRAEKQRLAAELAASRAVQQVLIPEFIPQVPGFAIQVMYEPFGEVGGDFYQILPLRNGDTLVAIGDVSGKGMGAAMMVSLLVGTLNVLAETESEPALLLAGLNRRVAGRAHGGFTTCLILRLGSDGSVALADAGHLAPYRNGIELSCPFGLPLGLSPESEYAESRLTLASGDHLTLLTDGVVEARNRNGELLGFDRTAAISTQSAEEIAAAAQAFGQDDDITVLTLTFAPVEVQNA